MGSCRMGSDPRKSVVDGEGQSWDVAGGAAGASPHGSTATGALGPTYQASLITPQTGLLSVYWHVYYYMSLSTLTSVAIKY